MLSNPEFYALSREYLKLDLLTLYEVVEKFRGDLLKDYKIPLRDLYSASNMTFQVYRTLYQSKPIEAAS